MRNQKGKNNQSYHTSYIDLVKKMKFLNEKMDEVAGQLNAVAQIGNTVNGVLFRLQAVEAAVNDLTERLDETLGKEISRSTGEEPKFSKTFKATVERKFEDLIDAFQKIRRREPGEKIGTNDMVFCTMRGMLTLENGEEKEVDTRNFTNRPFLVSKDDAFHNFKCAEFFTAVTLAEETKLIFSRDIPTEDEKISPDLRGKTIQYHVEIKRVKVSLKDWRNEPSLVIKEKKEDRGNTTNPSHSNSDNPDVQQSKEDTADA